MKPMACLFAALALVLIDLGLACGATGAPASLQLAQTASFSTWRPYKNPNRLITEGMNKGEVLAIAGPPDYKESYYRSNGRRVQRISDWYYVNSGMNSGATLLKFVEDTLVEITSTPIP